MDTLNSMFTPEILLDGSFPEILQWPKESQLLSRRHQSAIDSTTRILEIVLKARENSGSFSETDLLSMKRQYEYMAIIAARVEELRKLSEKLAFSFDKIARVSPALSQRFQNLCNSGIDAVLMSLRSVPVGTESIMTLFWLWSNQSTTCRMSVTDNLTRMLKAMMIAPNATIVQDCQRMFLWSEDGQKDPSREDFKVIKTWVCQSQVIKDSNEQKTPLDNNNSASTVRLYVMQVELKDPKIKSFYYCVVSRQKIFGGGYASTKEEAATRAYELFYEKITSYKFFEAKSASIGKEANINGYWLTEDEFANLPKTVKNYVSVYRDDARTDYVFVVGYQFPKRNQEKIVSTIKSLKRPSRLVGESDFCADITFENGITLSASLDWQVRDVRQHVEGEVFCKGCRKRYNGVMECDMRDIATIGPLCFGCMDNKAVMENMEIDHLTDV